MKTKKRIFSLLLLLSCINASAQLSYTCIKSPEPLIIDGHADESIWQEAPFTSHFVDIEGDKKPRPYYHTKVKMLWDDNYLYLYAHLNESHIWANLRQRDTVIFYDNDFEVFIDPDGDNNNYYEIEINALNTVWDLKLDKPYSKGGKPDNNWNVDGLISAIAIKGTLNNSSDLDTCWTIEMAIPWTAFAEDKPQKGSNWRINFSRVQWDTYIENNQYVKQKDPVSQKNLPERNWVWSPQGKINMHIPEKWGFLRFE